MNWRIPAVMPKATAQQKGVMIVNGKPRFFKRARIRAAERSILELLIAHKPANFHRLDGPVSHSISLEWPYRASERRYIVNTGAPVPHITRPDLDNLAKMVLDGLTTIGAWQDDSQVWQLSIMKRWAREGMIYIAATEAWQP